MAFYSDSQKKMQERFQSRALADRVEAQIVADELEDMHIGFIASRDFFFLSTVNGSGEPTVSYKGGNVGTLTVVDSKTIVFPAYDGNGMFLSVGNIDDTAKIGLLFIDFETPNRIRVQATAKLLHNSELMDKYPGAIALVHATVDKVFLNCARYIHKHQRVEATNKYVPDAKGAQPHPAWKRIDEVQDALPPEEQELTRLHGGTITTEQYGEKLMKGES